MMPEEWYGNGSGIGLGRSGMGMMLDELASFPGSCAGAGKTEPQEPGAHCWCICRHFHRINRKMLMMRCYRSIIGGILQ